MSDPWHIGQKVICISDSFSRAIVEWCDSVPAAGEVYTIRAIRFGIDPTTWMGDIGFLLVEVVNPPNSKGHEPGFFQDRFVPWLDVASISEAVAQPGRNQNRKTTDYADFTDDPIRVIREIRGSIEFKTQS